MNAETPLVPPAVYVVWWVGLIVTLALFVPLAVYLLHRAWLAARSIERYAADALQAAGGIARNTANIVALDATVGVAGELLAGAGSVARNLDAAATTLAARAEP